MVIRDRTAMFFKRGKKGGHAVFFGPTNTGKLAEIDARLVCDASNCFTGKTNIKLVACTDPEYGVVDETEKIIIVSDEADPNNEESKLAVIRAMPNWEQKYELYCLDPDLFTEEEDVEFDEFWALTKREPTDDDKMAWKLKGIFTDLKRRKKHERPNVMWLEDLADKLRKKEFRFIADRMPKMRQKHYEHTYLW